MNGAGTATMNRSISPPSVGRPSSVPNGPGATAALAKQPAGTSSKVSALIRANEDTIASGSPEQRRSLPASARNSTMRNVPSKPLPTTPPTSSPTSALTASPSSPNMNQSRMTMVGPGGERMTTQEKRDKVAMELLTTEETYVESLNNLYEYYVKPLEKRPDLIDMKDFNQVLGNMNQIVLINQELLAVLSTLRSDPSVADRLGAALCKFIPFLRLYSQYYSNFHEANSHLQKLMEKSQNLTEFLKGVQESANILDVGAILIQPVQRVPRYKLLLEQLIKYTADGHPDKPDLEKALDEVTVVAVELNKGVDLKEKYDELLLIQKRLSGKVPKNFVEYHRSLIHEGELIKLCRKTAKARYFLLFNNLLLYGEPTLLNQLTTVEEPGAAPRKPDINVHLAIPLYEGFGKMEPIEDSAKAKNAFEVLSKEKSFLLWAQTPEEKQVWVEKLELAAKQRAATISITGSASAAFAPKWQNDDECTNCPFCDAKFTALKRKHHCRQCGTLACGKCSEKKMDLPGIGAKQRVCDRCFERGASGEGADGSPRNNTESGEGSGITGRPAKGGSGRSTIRTK